MKKLIIAIIIVAVLGVFYAIDFVVAKSYEFEMVSAKPEVFVADGYSTVKISVKLTKSGKPVEGHSIVIVASNGTLPTARVTTDQDGIISFKYYPYLYLNDKLTPLEDVTFRFEDESNSSVFLIPATAEFRFSVKKPEGDSVMDDWQNLDLSKGEAI